MGAVNYGSSDYITLSIKPYNRDDIINDAYFIEWCNENGIEDYQAAADDEIQFYYECDRENAESIINSYNLYNYHVSVKAGYYEGLYIDIENNYPVAFDNYIEKREAQKEITRLKNMLVKLAGCGYVWTFPGWVTSYHDYNETIKGISEAIKEAREEARITPTWRDYEADRHYKHM